MVIFHSYVSLPEGIEKLPFIVDLPIKNGGFFHSYGTVYQRVPQKKMQ